MTERLGGMLDVRGDEGFAPSSMQHQLLHPLGQATKVLEERAFGLAYGERRLQDSIVEMAIPQQPQHR